VNELSDIGVAALKIEGRLKNARSIRRIVASYRAVLDAKATPEAVADELDLAFSRQWCEGFLQGTPKIWRTGQSVGHLGLRMGEVLEPANAAGRVLIQADRTLREGMGLSWNEPDGERDGRRGGVLVWTSGETGRVEGRFRGAGPSRKGLVLYATASSHQDDPCQGWNPAWDRIALRLRFEGRLGSSLQCRYDAEGVTGAVHSESMLQSARSGGVEDIVQERFGTMGEELVVEEIDTSQLERGLFVPPSSLKAMRREIVDGVKGARATAVASPVAEQPQVDVEAGSACAEYAIRVYQKNHVEAFLREAAPTLGWVLPLVCAQQLCVRALAAPVRYWIPWTWGPDAIETICPLLEELGDSEFLCFSWEAFELARRFPRHRFSVDWTFNVSNARAAEVLERCHIGYDVGMEAPGPLPGAWRVLRVNPLVSASRFPVITDSAAAHRNDRGDVFHLQSLGAAAGLFLERWPEALPAGKGPMRADAFVSPSETVEGFAQRLLSLLALPGT
jgi:hypothetical protein